MSAPSPALGGPANEIISYVEMCRRESSSLQRGMNFELGRGYSVLLMSLRKGAPYHDQLDADGSLIYEGHDVPRGASLNPKECDQPEISANGALTQNGLFYKSVQEYKDGRALARIVKVYEKIKQGIWSHNGFFQLVDAWREQDRHRAIFKFRLAPVGDEDTAFADTALQVSRRRIIPTWVKLEVWERDQGRCVVCGATDELHFDHDLPFSKGGTSLTADNVQLLCARHNLSKSNKIV